MITWGRPTLFAIWYKQCDIEYAIWLCSDLRNFSLENLLLFVLQHCQACRWWVSSAANIWKIFFESLNCRSSTCLMPKFIVYLVFDEAACITLKSQWRNIRWKETLKREQCDRLCFGRETSYSCGQWMKLNIFAVLSICRKRC